MMTVESTATLKRLMRQEIESRSCDISTIKKRSLTDQGSNNNKIHNPIWRQMVVEWCYQVIDHISADRELVYIAMNILDRFLAMHHQNKSQGSTRNYLSDKKAYETAVMTSLLMTMKLQGISALCVNDLVQMSSNFVSANEIIEVGKEIVRTLTWNKKIPTAARFAHAFVDLMPESIDGQTKMNIFENAVYQIELSIQDESCSLEPPSLVAWMAFENALSTSCIPKRCRTSIRSQITQEIGSDYSFSLRATLQSFHEYGIVSTNMPAVIPPDEDEEASSFPSESAVLNLKSRPLSECHVISVDDMTKIPAFPKPVKIHESEGHVEEQENVPTSTLRRTKKTRFC